MTTILPADLIFTQAQPGSWIGDQIRWWTRTWNEPVTKVSHIGVAGSVVYGRVDMTKIVEMTSPEGREVNLLDYYGDQDIYVYRALCLQPWLRSDIVEDMRRLIGKPYGYSKILLQLGDAALGKLISATYVLPAKLFGVKLKGLEFPLLSRLNLIDAVVCSQAVARAYWDVAGMHFGGEWPSRNPDAMLDWCERNPSLFQEVWRNEGSN